MPTAPAPTSLGQHAEAPTEVLDAATARLTAYFDRVSRSRSRRELGSPQVLVAQGSQRFRYGDQAMPFHGASMGKLVTAILVEKLLAPGTLVADVLDEREIRGLFDGAGATVDHLLAHRSGVADYFDGAASAGPRFLDGLVSDPEHHWTPEELLDFTRDRQKPVASPGSRFEYSDTGYVLLGRMLEVTTGSSLVELARTHVFDPIGAANSWYFAREEQPPSSSSSTIAQLWLGKHEVSGWPAVSCDWAGGGIAGTLDDFARLSAALHARGEDALVSDDAYARMCEFDNRFRPGIRYGAGMMQLRFEGFSPLLQRMPRLRGHSGVTGTHAFYDPEHDAHIILNFHSTAQLVSSFRAMITIVRELSRATSRAVR